MRIKSMLLGTIKGRPSFQRILEKLHRLLLNARGIGTGGEAETSGEKWALYYIRQKLKNVEKPVLFDVGANVGNYTKLLVENFQNGNILAFEPSPETFRLLNKKYSSPIRTFNFAFGNQVEQVLLYTNKNNNTIASMYKRKLTGKLKLEETEKIEVTTIDTFCNQYKIDYIDFLKLDVEGHELKCLQGASVMLSKNNIRFIQFEFGGCNIDSRTFFRDFFDLLKEKYKIYRIMQHGLYEITECHESYELFTTTNYLAEHR